MQPTLSASEWGYLNEGVLNLVLEYKGSRKQFVHKVLLISKEDQSAHPTQVGTRSLNQELLRFHRSIICQFKHLDKYLLQVDKVNITDEQKFRFIADVQNNLKTSKRNKIQYSEIDKEADIFIADNLFRPRIDCSVLETAIIQIKPKSVLLSRYLPQTIQRMASKLEVDYQAIIRTLEQSSQQQKTRWYKKMLQMKDKNRNKISPLDIFAHTAKNYLKDSLVQTFYKEGREASLQDIQNKEIYDHVINMALERSGILDHIYSLQLLFDKSSQHFVMYKMKEVEESIRLTELEDIKQIIVDSLKSTNKSSINPSQVNFQPMGQTLSIDIVKMLISYTWRDISLIIESNILGENSVQFSPEYEIIKVKGTEVACKITIIDYSLKPMSRVCDYSQKQNSALESYLRTSLKI